MTRALFLAAALATTLLTPRVSAADSNLGVDPVDTVDESGPGSEAKTDQLAQAGQAALSRSTTTKKELLERIRREGHDPARAFFPDTPSSPPTLLLSEVKQREIDVLITSILVGFEPEDADRILAAFKRVEPKVEPSSHAVHFGAVDELFHASTDLYHDPVKALASRPNLHLESVDPADFDYPVVLNTRVQNWMVYLLTRGRRHFVKWLARAERYAPLILPRLEEAGLPKDLLYQAMIESGFNPYATSHASAVGVWQFIASTGKAYGLDRDWWIDERRDPVMATDSAIEFMSHLYKRFGHWEIASAAYNAGGGKLSKAIRTYETDNYWELAGSDRPYLAAETKNYVPKLIAAAILGKYAERYGLRAEIQQEHLLTPWDFDEVTVPEATDLRVVAKLIGVEASEIEAINPALRRGYTPPGTANYRLNLPKGSGKKFQRGFATLPPSERTTFVRHKIRRGETLGAIAEDYGVPVATIQEVNKIRNPRTLKVGHRIIVPVRPDQIAERTITHLVDKGDSLSSIALRYKMSITQLKQRNGLKGDTIRLGQKLRVDVRGGGVQRGSAKVAKASSKSPGKGSGKKQTKGATWHRVKAGDSLSKIAHIHKLSVDELRKLNKLTVKSVIHPGDRLRVRSAPKGPRRVTYTVQSGDTVWGISSRHNMSVDEFRSLNGLKGNSIHPGQKLKVTETPGAKKSKKVSSHTVVAGDTLSQIAEKHGVRTADLKRWNGIKSDKIRLGQVLRISSR